MQWCVHSGVCKRAYHKLTSQYIHSDSIETPAPFRMMCGAGKRIARAVGERGGGLPAVQVRMVAASTHASHCQAAPPESQLSLNRVLEEAAGSGCHHVP